LRKLELGGGKKEPEIASSGLPGSEPVAPALPKALLDENQTTKLVYLYLEPYGEVEMSVRQLEALLGISHRPSSEAVKRLVKLELLKVLVLPINRPGRYRI